MKNIKHFLGIAVLMAIVASFSVSCSLSATQEQYYYQFIFSMRHQALENDIKADDVKKHVEESNKEFKVIGIQVKDTEAGKDIKKGTDGVTLKKRFPVSKN